MLYVAPSLLACDFAHLADELKRAEDAGADMIHVDVMDGDYVNNITIGPLIVEAARRSTKLPLNVHLMIQRPERYAKQFIEAGSDWLLVHPRAKGDPLGTIDMIRELGCKPGITLNPETPVSEAMDYLPKIDFFLLMSVNPGWGGQAFMAEVLPKFEQARPHCHKDIIFGIDGGINQETAKRAYDAGCRFLVAGTYLFRCENMAERISQLHSIDEEA